MNNNDRDVDIPTNRLYEGGIQFSEVLFDEIAQFSISWEDIDWDKPITTTKRQYETTAAAATQFQYANMSHLIICGRIIKNEVNGSTMDAQKLAVALAAYKVEGIEVWGRYVKKVGAGEQVSDELQRYYQHLFSEDDVVQTLVGMETLGGPLAYVVYKSLHNSESDDLFQQIVGNLIQQKEQEIELTQEYLTEAIASLSPDQTAQLRENAHTYRSIAKTILQSYDDELQAVDLDIERMGTAVAEEITAFYQTIGLE